LIIPKLEKQIGIEIYATKTTGIGGAIRQSVDDFAVEEVLVDGSKAEINNPAKTQVLGSSPIKNRYLLCILAKRNWDTFKAVKVTAEQLGINAERIQFAGIKDAKAVTAQHITIEGLSTEDIQKVHVKDLELRPIGYFHNELSTFYLLGNSFHIAIGTIKHSKTTIEKRIAKTIEELNAIGGCPNFFGYQRFGTTRSITHLVGKAIIQGNFKKAVMLFLANPSPYEHPQSKQAREQLQTTQNFKDALSIFPKQLRYERLMLRHLTEKSDDFAGAFRRLPPRLQELLPQAYQSYLFNRFLSRRIKLKVPLNRAEGGDYVVNLDRTGLPMLTAHRTVNSGNIIEINKTIKTGRMQLALPLIGFKQQPSLETQGEIENKILEEEGLSPQDFRIREMPEISLRGELRTALTALKDFSLGEIAKDAAHPTKCRIDVNFMLNKGSYATIILRELMKSRNLIKAGF